jgi:hypothetical protein
LTTVASALQLPEEQVAAATTATAGLFFALRCDNRRFAAPSSTMPNTFVVEVNTGPDPAAAKLKARFERVCALRLQTLASRKKPYPKAGTELSILDNFEGKLVAEMTEKELEENPPTEVNFTIESVEPAAPPKEPAEVRVVVRLEY